ncbi:MAG: hypothetical protein C0618_03975 [Desulfuromonas sp.]|nr:MAG: hypothetical protein C0618_03975 [Desulfuromonas sp.]
MRIPFFFVLLMLCCGINAVASSAPDMIEYPSRWGIISFDHQEHQRRAGECTVCHHQGAEMGACNTCHGVLPTTPIHKDVLHKLCKDCHREKRGPTECAGCHDPEHVDESVFQDN